MTNYIHDRRVNNTLRADLEARIERIEAIMGQAVADAQKVKDTILRAAREANEADTTRKAG